MTPLAERLRPESLDEYTGQDHLVGEGQVIRRMVDQKKVSSMIFWGPPGVGKTSLAHIIAKAADIPFVALSAVTSGVKDVKEVIQLGQKSGNVVLFIDEIHRFNKAQQDSLLGAVEKGFITLIGATTENPSFEVIPALLSRCQVYVLESFGVKELNDLLERAVEEGFPDREVEVRETDALFRLSGGDGRRLLNIIDLLAESVDGPLLITNDFVEKTIQSRMVRYDKTGEQHYDIISAFIKSIRGSDPNAAVYYLARMIEGGEDPKFIARRLLILASEDIGNANPNALLLATSCFQAVTMLGYPECELTLSQTTIYLAASPKSNSSYKAIASAKSLVRKTGDRPVPLAIRNAPTKLMKDLDYGTGYKYAHDFEGNYADMEFMPEGLEGTTLYQPGSNSREEEQRRYLRAVWKMKYNY
jgi:putative ATPase